MKPAIAVQQSNNRKTGRVSATYASQTSCPSSCPFYNNGCYAEKGFTGFTTHRLNKSITKSSTDIAHRETVEIDNLRSNGQHLRLHVVGDCKTPMAAMMVSNAASRFIKRSPEKTYAWTYTHAWMDVSRHFWNSAVNVLASIQNPEEIPQALEQGYSPAIVVDDFPNQNKAFTFEEYPQITFIPCLEQTQGIVCADCQLCLKPNFLFERQLGIAFKKH